MTGAQDDLTEISLWIWLARTGVLAVPATGNFPKIGFWRTVGLEYAIVTIDAPGVNFTACHRGPIGQRCFVYRRGLLPWN